MYHVGLLYLSPDHPEMEIMRRIKVALNAIGCRCSYITPRGYDIESNKDITSSLDFVFLFDPSHHTFIDSFVYHVHWFCPGITSNSVKLNYNYSSLNCDFHLLFPSSKIVNGNLVSSHMITSNSESYLYPSVPKEFVIPAVCRKEYKLFYCGVNNDGTGTIRHSELFSNLDNSGLLHIFGPEYIGERKNWEGIDSYKGEIPFDGSSVVKYAASCGVYLVLQHDLHNIYGMMTNRLFEGCAAGCLIITDDTPFVRDNFGDSVFYLDKKGKSSSEVAEDIISVVMWANNNPEAAYEKAKKSQDIFFSKFLLDDAVSKVVDSHSTRLVNDEDTPVLVDIFVTNRQLEKSLVRQNLKSQYYRKIRVVVAIETGEQLSGQMKEFLSEFDFLLVECQSLFSHNEKYSMLSVSRNNISGECFLFVNEFEHWHRNHVSNLVRVYKTNKEATVVYSGSYIKESEGLYNTALTFRPISGLSEYITKLFREESSLLELSHLLPTSSMMFSSRIFSKEYLNSAIILDDPSYLLLTAALVDDDIILYGNKVSLSIDRDVFIDYLNRNAEIFTNKSFATPKGAILDTVIHSPHVIRKTHGLSAMQTMSDVNRELSVKIDKLEEELGRLRNEVVMVRSQSAMIRLKRFLARIVSRLKVK
ncbi:hypothetical protein OH456_20395 [Vibrio sp. La 4.2.2]|uniref:hypothetical protein n=1 Tax=Vibrio sp. La 4.2.2 TaxID=2998830 RepID=UPI0022CDF697|nr:hypothetical protein [Vibrio sp. La 4.2.2]MDA0110528.1 hypothetical protein [Vibrio sp. La 4.2.2]